MTSQAKKGCVVELFGQCSNVTSCCRARGVLSRICDRLDPCSRTVPEAFGKHRQTCPRRTPYISGCAKSGNVTTIFCVFFFTSTRVQCLHSYDTHKNSVSIGQTCSRRQKSLERVTAFPTVNKHLHGVIFM